MDKSQDKQSDSKAIVDYVDWLAVSKHNGWLVYEQKLKSLIESYNAYMDNINANGEMLKNLQLIKKGLKMALDIPRTLEMKAKSIKKKDHKPPSRINNFFRVGK